MIVAEITKDHISADNPEYNQEGRTFDYDAMCDWWGWHDLPDIDGWLPKAQTEFKLYDDDDELYYEGWLLNEDECIVQQFVQKWAESYAGCTTILVYKDAEAGYIQEIG